MKKIISIILVVLTGCLYASGLAAQTIPEGYEEADSLVYRQVDVVDKDFAGKDVFGIMPSKSRGDEADVEIRQSQEIKNSMRSHVEANAKRTMSGYRVRIFFDNRQSARNDSEATLKKFRNLYPEVVAYRIYANPYFKVTVGDFRTKSEAMELLTMIKGAFPSAFVVKENIEYPVVDSENAVVVDTVKVLRPIR